MGGTVHERSVVRVGASLLVATLALTACGSRSNDSDNAGGAGATKTAKIGVIAPLSGDLAALGLGQAGAVVAFAEALPLPDAAVDCVVANGILNLSPDRSAILAEVARVLRPGGRFILAETTLRHELPPGNIQSLEDWFR